MSYMPRDLGEIKDRGEYEMLLVHLPTEVCLHPWDQWSSALLDSLRRHGWSIKHKPVSGTIHAISPFLAGEVQ